MIKPKYRSARAVPAPTTGGGRSIVKAIRIFMAVSAVVFLLTMITTMKHFHSIDASLKDHVNNAPAVKAIMTGNEKRPPKNQVEMGHGVHANVQNHLQGLKEHLKVKLKENTTQQQTPPKQSIENGTSKENSDIQSTSKLHDKKSSAENSDIQSTSKLQDRSSTENRSIQSGSSLQEQPSTGKSGIQSTSTLQDKSSTENRSDIQPSMKALRIHSSSKQSLARGHSGLPMEQTPALIGAKRGSIQCDSDADISSLAYWNDPQGSRDEAYVSPFRVSSSSGKSKYLTFEADDGGFNNIRMSFENIVVMAAATGRVLVLPPEKYMYLLHNRNNFDHFFPLFNERFQKKVRVITMKQFLEVQFAEGGYFETEDKQTKEDLLSINESCEKIECDEEAIFDYIRRKSYISQLKDTKNCLIFDQAAMKSGSSAITSPKTQGNIKKFCGPERLPVYYDSEMAEPDILHFQTSSERLRLLNHFYTVIYFTDPAENNYYKRLIRDFIHYRDELFCAAGKIINLIREEGAQLGFKVDDEGAGGFSALHIRRGDLQFKEVIISAEEWYENTAKLWQPNEILYIATDEMDRTFFEPIAKHHQLRFLDDYLEKAGLAGIEKQYLGMIESIIASRGRIFVGTWHSTFSAYIMRLRGYYGVSKMDNYYSYKPRRFEMNRFHYHFGSYYAREWPTAWLGIDGDNEIVADIEPNSLSPIGPFLDITLLKNPNPRPNHLARGMFGLPMSKTPALEGASRGTIQCDVNVDSLAYWNDPQGTYDTSFSSPFRVSGKRKQYITFWQDAGRFNNMRMSLEIIFVIAAATGRTVVLPPSQNLRMEHGSNSVLGFEHFYSFDSPQFRKNVDVITMTEFIKREGAENGVAKINKDDLARLLQLAQFCENRRKSDSYCGEVFDKLLAQSDMMMAPFSDKNCLVFDVDTYKDLNAKAKDNKVEAAKQFCGVRRPVFYTEELARPDILHFDTFEPEHRLLSHFYNFVLFTDPAIDNHFKRFVRDFMHYNDKIFCAAGKIVRLIQQEALDRGFAVDDEGGGGYSSLHVRRDDLQFKDAVISEDRWWDNTKEIYQEKEILYIATDEKNKRFFDHFAASHDLRFLDDYWDALDLGSFEKEYLGMIDAIVASRGRAFVGTYFSTFTGYIFRMRGYHGMSKLTNWYSWKPTKFEMQQGKFFEPVSSFEREYAIGWVDIDGNSKVIADKDYINPTSYNEVEPPQVESIDGKDVTKSNEREVHPTPNAQTSPEQEKDQKATEGEKLIGFSLEEDEKLELAADGTKMYIIFSTDCSLYQQWQSYLFFFSAFRVRQPGTITRIASGCTDEEKKNTEQWHNDHIALISNRYKVFFTPKFSHIDEDTETGSYKFFNKPFGTKYYIENNSDFGWDESSGKLTKAQGNEVIMLLDPDMLLLQPLTTDFSDSNVKFWKPFHKDTLDRKKKVAPGAMFGQTYGLGTKWMNFKSLAGPNSPAQDVDERNAQLLYQVGPPYIGVATDMYRVVNRWAELVRAVHKEKPQLLAEMYAYQIAAADQKLPHGVVDSMMISVVNGYGEAWDYIDALPNEEACRMGASPNPNAYPLPTLLHYCQHYGVANVLFSKKVTVGTTKFFTCQSSLLKEPPSDAMSSQNAYLIGVDGKRRDLDSKEHKRHVFSSCAITSAMNEALQFFKLHHCDKSEASVEN